MDLNITNDEAIVLWNLLRRYSERDLLGTEDQAEQRALWNLECVLEKMVGNLYEGEWEVALKAAYEKLRDENGTNAIYEKESGRVALWLEPEEIRFIISDWRKVPDEASEQVKEAWGKLYFRCNTALHKAGISK